MPASKSKTSAEQVAKYADMFSAMGTEPRLRIMQLLLTAHPEGLVVGDIQEELVRLNAHVKHFLGLLDQNGEVGKKMDFLLQEMNREANTMLSKTSGLAGEALKVTEMGLLIKSEIEKSREQVQNLE